MVRRQRLLGSARMAREGDMASDLDQVGAQVAPLKEALGELQGLAEGFGRAMTTAFRRSLIDGRRLEDVLRSITLSLSGRALNAALAPIRRGIGSAIAGLFGGGLAARFAKGGVTAGATPFATGGVVRRPSYFPLRSGLGMAGEAGPEAILPLARGADGRLGVRAETGRSAVNVTFNVTTADAASFRRAEAELTAMLARAVARGQRGL
jgi:phage-related minor tail protein